MTVRIDGRRLLRANEHDTIASCRPIPAARAADDPTPLLALRAGMRPVDLDSLAPLSQNETPLPDKSRRTGTGRRCQRARSMLLAYPMRSKRTNRASP